MNGFAFLVFPVDGEPILISPEAEKGYAEDGWVQDLRFFPWGLVDSGDPFAQVSQLLSQGAADLELKGRRIGFEGSFEFVASPYVAGWPSVFSQCRFE